MPERPRNALSAYLESAAAAAPQLRWVPPENLHLTLRFLGGVSPELLERLRSGLAAIRSPPFDLGLGGVGTFGGRRVRVVWLGLESGASAAVLLAEAVEAVCIEAGAAAEPRPFRAHLTLARSRERQGIELPELPPAPASETWTADRFILYRSRLRSGPARYEVLQEIVLRRRPVSE